MLTDILDESIASSKRRSWGHVLFKSIRAASLQETLQDLKTRLNREAQRFGASHTTEKVVIRSSSCVLRRSPRSCALRLDWTTSSAFVKICSMGTLKRFGHSPGWKNVGAPRIEANARVGATYIGYGNTDDASRSL